MVSRNRAWADTGLVAQSIASAGEIVTDLLANAPALDTITAVRIIGYLDVAIPITSEVQSSESIDVGIGVAAVEAFTVAGSSLPNPRTDTEFPPRGWLYRARRISWQFKAANNEQQQMHAVFQWDVRAARKVDKGRLFMTITSTPLVGTAVVDVTGLVRVLCLT